MLSPGYIPGSEALSAVLAVARKLKERNRDLIYLLDRELHIHDISRLVISCLTSSCAGRLWETIRFAGRHTYIPSHATALDDNHTELV